MAQGFVSCGGEPREPQVIGIAAVDGQNGIGAARVLTLNRLVAAELERRWNQALTTEAQLEAELATLQQAVPGIAAVAPKLSDRHGARRTSRNMRDRD